ncbi:PREDICTED: unknown [Prunus dulcis]|nr:PREDICTED: unknown [Prunus dulcis]
MGNQSMNSRQKQDVVRTHNFETQRTKIMKGRSYSKKESALRINQERINHGMEDTLRKSAPKFDLNQKVRALSGKEATLQKPTPNFDLNQKERIQIVKESSTKRKSTPVFDLNQISREEEEEFQANCEPLRIEEPNKSLLRGGNDEQHSDMKLLVCRTIGNGSNRSGKRKITWQDQVALRV